MRRRIIVLFFSWYLERHHPVMNENVNDERLLHHHGVDQEHHRLLNHQHIDRGKGLKEIDVFIDRDDLDLDHGQVRMQLRRHRNANPHPHHPIHLLMVKRMKKNIQIQRSKWQIIHSIENISHVIRSLDIRMMKVQIENIQKERMIEN